MPKKKKIENNQLKKVEERKKEVKKNIKGIAKNKKIIADNLINRYAFINVLMEELEEEIINEGISEAYQNGRNQNGRKKTAEFEGYNTLFKNEMTAMQEIIKLIPEEEKGKGNGTLIKFLNAGNKAIGE